ncbi:YecA family protein [Inmirania thermothiophila]|uniref:YecA family protein n=1 Tax=Inmirania thermothiophila TaxID=1750597 RepID=A0A3N1Y7G1_9GAMM|nr:UPF0149 family protein [Inmirania thermothiophila]ROR34451.1 uncharacterized protein EDC57_0349 [Inmirania thermothiophila]
MVRSVDEPLADADYRRLEAFLASDACGEEALFVDEVHGLFTAIVCGPEPVGPSEWLPVICDGNPVFEDLAEAEEILDLLMRMHNEIAATLALRGELEPLFAEREEAGGARVPSAEGWCQGFIRGMSLRGEQWQAAMGGELVDLLYPIVVLAQIDDEEAPEADLSDPERYRALCAMIPRSVGGIYAHWRRRMAAGAAPAGPDPGAGEACPCGSGLPFDECCGGAGRSLH